MFLPQEFEKIAEKYESGQLKEEYRKALTELCQNDSETRQAALSAAENNSKEKFFNNYPMWKDNLQYDEIKYAYNISGGYICGVFNPSVYLDVVIGCNSKGKATANRETVKAKDHYKCYLKNGRILFSEFYLSGKLKTEEIFFIYKQNAIAAYVFSTGKNAQLDGKLISAFEAKYKNGYISSYIDIFDLNFSDDKVLFQREKAEYAFDDKGIKTIKIYDPFEANVFETYSFENENGYIKHYIIDNEKYDINKPVSSFSGKYCVNEK